MGCGTVDGRQSQGPEPALTLNRIYQRLELIGSGTFGKVYLCRNNLNGLNYALKVVDITASSREEAVRQVEALKAEIRVLRKLSHPNIVKYYSFDISEDARQVEIVLEYAQQDSLKAYVRTHGPLSEAEAIGRMAEILEGLSYLHAQSIVHRDLKCANILVMEDGTLKISDFGTAKHVKTNCHQDIANKCASLKGTPYYMAPEILRRTGHNTSADIWSLGCLLIEMLTGKAPWTALTTDFQ
jgi:mitogen-activated protein kinase kinase kinase ANP1